MKKAAKINKQQAGRTSDPLDSLDGGAAAASGKNGQTKRTELYKIQGSDGAAYRRPRPP